VGKWLVLLAAAQAGRLWLVALGAVNVVMALYYYLLIVKRMYLEPPPPPRRWRSPP
jgi:NADH-quinone oxidoreductase subunit N